MGKMLSIVLFALAAYFSGVLGASGHPWVGAFGGSTSILMIVMSYYFEATRVPQR